MTVLPYALHPLQGHARQAEEGTAVAVSVGLQAAELLHLSVDGLAKLRRRAYRKIADGQNESTD